ncbi:hypothetical protein BGZ49_004741 [Haplosporangium sp. Z 27]|nr:hypothetical protein BGZ49_004741 [Haplosporangium sp. Z 27]
MLRSLFWSPPSGLSLEDTLGLANKYLKDADDTYNPVKALILCHRAKAMLKDVERIVDNEDITDPTFYNGIAETYRKLGKLMGRWGRFWEKRKCYKKDECYTNVGLGHYEGDAIVVMDFEFELPGSHVTTVEALSEGVQDLKIVPPILRDDTKDVTPWDCVIIPRETLKQLEKTRTSLKDEVSVTIYSDGSMTEADGLNILMAFGVVFKNYDESFPIVTTGRVTGFASSTKAELVGLLAAIMASPEI